MYASSDAPKAKKTKKKSSKSKYTVASSYDPALIGQLLQQVQGAGSVGNGFTGAIPPVTAALPQLAGATVAPKKSPALSMGNNTNYGAGNGEHPSATYGASVADTDPIDAAMASLYKLANSAANSPSATGYSQSDVNSMLSQAGAAGNPYTAQIQTIKNQNAGAKSEATTGSKKIQAMYRALAKDDAKNGQQSINSQEQLANKINQQAATGNNANQARAQALMSDNAKYGGDVAAQLNTGIAQAATTKQAANTQQAANYAATALKQGGNFNNYFKQSQSADRLAGTNKASDLITQLQSYLQGNRDKISELAGQRSAAVTSSRASILSQIADAQGKAQSSAYDAKQDQFKNLSTLLGMQTTRQNTQDDNNRADQQLALQLQNAQDKKDSAGQLTSEDLLKILSSSGAYKNMGQDDIMKQIQKLLASQ
jgi:hypothetical protein